MCFDLLYNFYPKLFQHSNNSVSYHWKLLPRVCYFYPILTKLYLKIQVRAGAPSRQPTREKQGVKGLANPVLKSVMTLQNVGNFTPIDTASYLREQQQCYKIPNLAKQNI